MRNRLALTLTYTAALTVFYWLGIACRYAMNHLSGV